MLRTNVLAFSLLLILLCGFTVPAQDIDPVVPLISQIAAGGTWRTTIVLANTTSSSAPFKLRFRDSLGNPLITQWQKTTATTVGDPELTVEIAGEVPGFGLVSYRTVDNPSASTQVGYAQLIEGTGITGQAIFQQVQPNGRVYAAASPLAMPMSRFILPIDNTSGALTAAAVANPSRGSNPLEIAMRRDAGGDPMEEPTRLFEPWQHRAELVSTMFSPTAENKFATADVWARNAAVGILGLRFLPNSGPFTSFVAVDKDPWPGNLRTRPCIAQIASGGPWTTTLLLVNIQPIPAAFRMEFRDSSGSALAFTWVNLTPSTVLTASNPNELAGTIPPGGIAVFQTAGDFTSQVRQGYARLLEGNLVKGQAIFTQTTAAGVRYEAASPLRAGSAWIQAPFDSAGSETGLAIVNTTSITTVLTVRVNNEDGTLLGTARLGLQPFEHKAGTVATLFPDLAAAMRGKRGIIELVSLPSEIHALGLRFEGEFFTSFPVSYLQ